MYPSHQFLHLIAYLVRLNSETWADDLVMCWLGPKQVAWIRLCLCFWGPETDLYSLQDPSLR